MVIVGPGLVAVAVADAVGIGTVAVMLGVDTGGTTGMLAVVVVVALIVALGVPVGGGTVAVVEPEPVPVGSVVGSVDVTGSVSESAPDEQAQARARMNQWLLRGVMIGHPSAPEHTR
jgi:hypothetical protein